MKNIVAFACFLLLFYSASAQYVRKNNNEIWGQKENQYAELGDQVLICMDEQMYNNAISLLNKMIALKSKNADIEKDYYTLGYCYFALEQYDKLEETTILYESIVGEPKEKRDSLNLKMLLAYNGMGFAFSGNPNKALIYLEKSILYSDKYDYKNISQCRYFMSKCYSQLSNQYQARLNMKKAINYRCKELNTTVSQIEKNGVNDPGLGRMFYDFRIFEADSYKAFVYLNYLAVKCNFREAVEEHSYMLQDPTIINGHPTNLFDE